MNDCLSSHRRHGTTLHALTAPLLLLTGWACAGTPAEQPPAPPEPSRPAVLLAVFAHPDDEIIAGPALSRYAAEGHAVHLLTLTSGQIGDAHTDIPRGDALGAAREDESRCSAAALGIEEPVLPGFMDGGIAPWGGLPEIRRRVREEMRRVRPDVVITWGPDGLSGHTDHRIASSLATEIFQESWGEIPPPQKLYYAAVPAQPGQAAADVQGDRASITPDLVTTQISAQQYVEQTREAMHCHKTQWNPPEAVDQMFEDRQALLQGNVYFHLAMSRVGHATARETDLLERVVR